MNYLGIDYGLKKTGLAIADGPLAEPLAIVDTDTVLTYLTHIIEKLGIDELVIGQPEGEIAPQVRKFADEKLTALRLPVHVVDETLSSADARRALLHTTQSRRKAWEHAVAAALILQSWLDSDRRKL